MGGTQSVKVVGVLPPGHETLSEYTPGTHWGVEPNFRSEPKYAKAGVASAEKTPLMTIPGIFQKCVENVGNQVALAVERPVPPSSQKESLPWDQWKKWTWAEYQAEVKNAAKAMIKLGVAPHSSVNIFGYNSPEWVIADMAAIFAGAKAAGIYPTDTPDQVAFKCHHSGAVVAVLETDGHVKKIKDVIDDIPNLKTIVVWTETKGEALTRSNGSTVDVISWEAFMKIGAEEDEMPLQKRIAAIDARECCTLIYTSGTTGNPKAVMLSHDNIVFEASAVMSVLPGIGEHPERGLSYLPLSHVAGMLLDIVTPMVVGAWTSACYTLYFARPYDLKEATIGGRLTFVKPTRFLGVPRVWEKIAEQMQRVGASTTGLKKSLVTWAKGHGLNAAKNGCVGGNGKTSMMYPVASALLNKAKVALGLEECKFAFTGAAPISADILEYFGQIGINVNEVYGMSECCGCTTASTDETHIWGSCGFAIPGTEVRIFKVSDTDLNSKEDVPPCADIYAPTEAEQGEICFRGRHIMMGYMANPEMGEEHVAEMKKKTGESIDADGWLHSGDKGCMDKNGMFRITGRYKELIIGSGGENIAPIPIEDNIKSLCPAISNIMMVGDKRKFNTALVTLKTVGATGELPGTDELMGPALELNPEIKTLSAAIKDPLVRKKIEDAIKATNSNPKCCLNNAFKIQKFEILPRDFSVQTEELTPTLKLKRGFAAKLWADTIETMYE